MSIVKLKFIGSSTRFTTNNIYDVIGFGGATHFIVIDDLGETIGVSPNGPDFELESVDVLDVRRIYP